MSGRDNRWLFAAVYGFMSSSLGLSGYAKEVFAIIFGFWEHASESPVAISLSVMQAITGASRPAVVTAIRLLEKTGLVVASKHSGKTTTYDVHMNPGLLAAYHQHRARQGAKTKRERLIPETRTSKVAELQTKTNKKIYIKTGTNHTVPSPEDFLKEFSQITSQE